MSLGCSTGGEFASASRNNQKLNGAFLRSFVAVVRCLLPIYLLMIPEDQGKRNIEAVGKYPRGPPLSFA